MFIHSKFRDYYDAFVAPGNRDPKIVYKRETRVIELKDTPRTKLGWFCRASQLVYGYGNSHYVELILFCGKVYPFGLMVSNDYNLPDEKRKRIDYKNPYAEFKTQRYMKREEIEAGTADEDANRLNRTLAPVIRFHHGGTLTLNPKLGELRFPMNGSQAIQTLMGFLAPQDPETVQTADTYRIAAHGYDAGSFRREKGGPSRKRKKTKTS